MEIFWRTSLILLSSALSVAAQSLTVATYNVRFDADKGDLTWAKRQPRVVEVVRRGGFDIVGFQEVRTDMWAGFTNALSEYAWTDGARLVNPIAYRPKLFECLTNGLWSISEDPADLKRISWGSSSPRQWRWALLKERATGRLLRVFSIHPDWKSAKARAKGMVRILAEAKKARVAGEHVILLGDFNDADATTIPGSPSDPAYPFGTSLRLAREVLRDARQVATDGHAGPVNTFNAYKEEANCCIDHIFVSSAFKVKRTRTHDERPDGGFPSDHWAFSAHLTW